MSKTGTIWTIVIIVVLIIIGVLVYKSNDNDNYGAMATTTTQTTTTDTGTAGQPAAVAMPEPQATSTVAATTTPVASTTKGSVVLTAVADPTLGTYLVASNGMTVYTDSKDSANVSTCTGSCASAWPPYTVAGSYVTFTGGTGVRGQISAITRADGTKQITYNGLPLYFWQGDKKAGDTTGNGVGGFSIVRE